ncbi:MAG: DHH family phosphoesterase [Planctomycetes bacterium]|nr:DHH family phosphoesterase [Planctomycetota bacterium]
MATESCPSPRGERLALVLRTLADGEVLLLSHNNPDPDGVGGMLALSRLVRHAFGRETCIAYAGTLGRAENRALVSSLEIPLVPFTSIDLARFARIVLVDAQPEFQNHPLRARTPDLVIDHHPEAEARPGPCVRIIDPSYGSTSGLLADLLEEAGVEIDSTLATALYYGIKSDTQDLTRGGCEAEVRWLACLHAQSDRARLRRILYPRLQRTYYVAFRDAIECARVYADSLVVVPFPTPLAYPDLVADFADFFVRLDGIRAAVVFGRHQDEIHVSVRTTQGACDAGVFARQVVEGRGPSGGHGLFAGGQIPLIVDDPTPVADALIASSARLVGVGPEAFARIA